MEGLAQNRPEPRRAPWPKPERKEAALGLAESKLSLESITPEVCAAFRTKGYDTVYCEPAGIGYHNPVFKENLVYAEGGSDSNQWRVADREPAYLYPAMQNDSDLGRALRNIHEKLEFNISRRSFKTFVPEPEDLQVVQRAIGADTLCLSRVHGIKYSEGRKAGAIALSVALLLTAAAVGATPTGVDPRGPSDFTELAITCVSLASGTVFWQSAILRAVDPIYPDSAVVPALLQRFPDKGRPFEPELKKD
jgi:hypothetical protein